ncbi:hypothetical protein GWK47_000798 [Chionoecetes opilio]|uniref:Integrase p58-like C-terminal domain-containing protein n=1 Tax=Chionoecetes opilio TaxID=41210 RepID=A0A8J5CQ35_CHIOP|nr:hypothetical protein GWK47_000798 [Chionoecetes opilio]
MATATTPYAVALKERMEEIHHQVRGNLRIAGEAMKTRYDRHTEVPVFQEGQQVWLYNPRRKKGQSPKLQSPWEGPYTVVEVISDVTFRIRRLPRRRTMVVHADRLWRYYGSGHYSWEDGTERDVLTPEPCGSEGDEERAFWPEEEDAGDMRLVPLTSLEPSEQAAAEEPTSVPVDVGDSEVQAAGLGGARPKRPRRTPRWMEDFILEGPEG